MQITFLYTNNPNLGEVESYNRFTHSFQLPDMALELSDLQQRVADIGRCVGKLTKASLYVTCRAVGLNNYHIKDCDYDYTDRKQRIHETSYTAKVQFRFIEYGMTRTLSIYHPIEPAIAVRDTIRKKRKRPRISHGLDPQKYKTPEEQAFVQLYRDLADNLLALLNSHENANWRASSFHPWYLDNQLIKDINKSFRARERAQR